MHYYNTFERLCALKQVRNVIEKHQLFNNVLFAVSIISGAFLAALGILIFINGQVSLVEKASPSNIIMTIMGGVISLSIGVFLFLGSFVNKILTATQEKNIITYHSVSSFLSQVAQNSNPIISYEFLKEMLIKKFKLDLRFILLKANAKSPLLKELDFLIDNNEQFLMNKDILNELALALKNKGCLKADNSEGVEFRTLVEKYNQQVKENNIASRQFQEQLDKAQIQIQPLSTKNQKPFLIREGDTTEQGDSV